LWRVSERIKYQKYYINMSTTVPKIAFLLKRFRFCPVRDLVREIESWPACTP
jgi:hypothetical protein